ncbi:diaminopimelate decarboxylase [Candidatus Woesearchaeota archaeon]|nr:diaminopimelate decarboxylase [Candidatus Woesearchaeota archaeon]
MNSNILRKILELVRSADFDREPYFYLYSMDKINTQLSGLKENLPENVALYYAMKANPNKEILCHLKKSQKVNGIEVSSAGELEKALEFFEPKEIIATGPGKNRYELQRYIEEGIRQINVESYIEAIRIKEIVKKTTNHPVDVLVRVNIDYSPEKAHILMSGFSSKFGIDEKGIEEQTALISNLEGISLQGIHVFAGNGVLDHEIILDYFNYIFGMVNRLENKGEGIPIIDLGGGFGIDYKGEGRSLDIVSLGKNMSELISKQGYENKELILELGRYIVGESGYYVTEILDIKESKGKKHIITAGGINHQRRPCATETNHPVEIISMKKPLLHPGQPSVRNEIIDIGGPLCLSADILAKDIQIKNANIGDLVVVHQSGAYGSSMGANNFLSHPIAKEYLLR